MQDEQPRVGTGPAAVPWSAAEIFLALFLVYGFWASACYQGLEASGFYRWFYGPDLVALANEPIPSQARDIARTHLHLWVTVLALPFQVATIPLLFYEVSGTRPSQLGLTTRRLGANILAGTVGALVLTPAVMGLNLLVTVLYQRGTGAGPEEHAFTRLAQTGLKPAEWAVLVLSATVSAPLLEELIFRGALLRWLAKHSWGGHAAMITALLLSLFFRRDEIRAAWPRAVPLAEALAPALFILALVPFYFLVWRRAAARPAAEGAWDGPAVFGSAAVFGIVHTAWPTPVALFVLGLGLGYLAQRTRSLAAPVVVHALLNGTTCLFLFWH